MEAAAIVAAAAAAAGSAANAYSTKRSGDRQERAAREQLANAERLNREEDQARNKANRKQADIMGTLESNKVEGLGNTSLTGAMGAPVDPNSLGKGSSLLGS
jgi:hypothetical protein